MAEFDEFSEFVLFDRGCTDGRPVSADCLAVCTHGALAMCDRDWCACQCHQGDDEPEEVAAA